MTKHSFCIRDPGQIPKSRLEDACGPTLCKNLPSASAWFYDNRKQRCWNLRQLDHSYPCSSASSPTEAMSSTKILTFHLLQYVLLPKIQPVVYKESAWVSVMLGNQLPAWHRPYMQLRVEGKGWNFAPLAHDQAAGVLKRAVVTTSKLHRYNPTADVLHGHWLGTRASTPPW